MDARFAERAEMEALYSVTLLAPADCRCCLAAPSTAEHQAPSYRSMLRYGLTEGPRGQNYIMQLQS